MASQVAAASLKTTDRSLPPISIATREGEVSRSLSSTSMGTPKHEGIQMNTQSVTNDLESSNRDQNTIAEQVSIQTKDPLKKHVLYSLITVITIGVTSVVSAFWLIAYIQTRSKNEYPYISAEIVGGRFSSTAAKLIDAAFSMLVAPAIIAIANWHMFKLARLSVVNEHRGRNSAVSMKVLVEVANTDWGSFSPLKFWTFVRSRRPRVVCLGAIAVLSALSFALLSNVVAYQAGMMLEYLYDVDSLPLDEHALSVYSQALHPKVSETLQDSLNGLQPLMLESAADGLLKANVSDRSRARLPEDVKKLFDAPVYRLNLSCTSFTPRSVRIEQPDGQNPHIRITFDGTVSALESETTSYQANFGRDESVLSEKSLNHANVKYPGIRYPLVAFNRTAIWIGSINANQSSGINSDDGSYHLALSGMKCHLSKSNGRADIKVNGSNWNIIKDTLFNEQHEPRPSEAISSLTSTLNLFNEGSIGRAPGLGGHLLRTALNITSDSDQPSWKLQTLLEAVLWFEAESRHILLDGSQSRRAAWYQIQCDTDRYAMTFIPWILLTGLVSLGAACAITVGLAIDSWKVHSLRIGRMLDSIRLTADVGVALDKQVFEECSTWHGSKLNKCADGARFQYEADTRVDSKTGLYSTGIRLRQISRPHE